LRSVGGRGLYLAEDGIDVLLGRDDDPGPASAGRAQVLGDGLEIQHEVGIGANVLANLIHQKDEPMLWSLLIEVGLDPRAKVLDGQ
jgi:hypothetical protein